MVRQKATPAKANRAKGTRGKAAKRQLTSGDKAQAGPETSTSSAAKQQKLSARSKQKEEDQAALNEIQELVNPYPKPLQPWGKPVPQLQVCF